MSDDGAKPTDQQPDPSSWGQPIDDDRKATLDDLAARQRAWIEQPTDSRGDSVFKDVELTGADVFWLAQRALAGADATPEMLADAARRLQVTDLTELLGTDLTELLGIYLSGLHLEGANLRAAHLEGAYIRAAHLERAFLIEAHLERAYLVAAHLEDAYLAEAHLEGAFLIEAHLERAYLTGLHLEGADLRAAHLEGADLRAAHLEGRVYLPDDVNLVRMRTVVPAFPATLLAADLREAFLDGATTLRDSTLCTPARANAAPGAGPHVADIRWNSANLAVLDWTSFTERGALLGDEQEARDWRPVISTEAPALKQAQRGKRAAARREHAAEQQRAGIEIWATAARANRQLATALRGQGMSDEADHFAYRAQVCQRRLLLVRGKRWQARFSSFLNLLAGYGYKPERTLYIYVVVIAVFSAFYLLTSHGLIGFGMPLTGVKPLLWYQAIILSISAFHGRGFFQELPGDPVALCAAIEAICGLVIEVSFIATFTQRFFGGK
jgi:uncharacterized protein YjbI with pentapeptide repeats